MTDLKIPPSCTNSRNIREAYKTGWHPLLPLAEVYALYAVSHSQKIPVGEDICIKARALEATWGYPLIEGETLTGDGLKSCILTTDGRRLANFAGRILKLALTAEQVLIVE